MSPRLAARLCYVWLIVIPLLTIWNVATYSGLYRWLCEWQLDHNGQYEALLTATIPAIVLIAPAVRVLIHLQRRAAPPAATPLTPAQATRVFMRVTGVIGLAGVALCMGLLAWAASLPSGNEPPVRIDLAALGAAAPPLGAAILIGWVDGRNGVSRLGGSKAPHLMRTDYFPVRALGATAGPVRFVVDLYGEASAHNDIASIFADGRLRGVLVENGLPHDMLRALQRRHIVMTTPYYFLTTTRGGPRMGAYVAAAFAGVAALVMLVLAAAAAIQLRAFTRPPIGRRLP